MVNPQMVMYEEEFNQIQLVVDKLVKEGFYEQLFGPGIKAEEERKAKLAFR